MLFLLPSAWLGCFLICREMMTRGWIGADWRFAFLLASACWGALVAFGTEFLSLGTSLDFSMVRLFWLLANVSLWGGLFLWRRRAQPRTPGWTLAVGIEELRDWPLDARLLLGAALLFAAFLGGIALLTTTTNWDSLTYHMARVMHWIQQRSVAHYPTNMDAQLQMGPWSGFVQAHLWLLWGSDRLENMVQWSAMAGCMVVATLLVKQLLSAGTANGARAEAMAALLIVTLPTGIVESISTQTDYTTGFWLLCLGSLALAWCREPANRVYAAGFGAGMGLGVLTKFTFVIYGAPIGIATAGLLIWKQRRAIPQLVMPAIAALAICLALALPHLLRNQAVYGSAVGSKTLQSANAVARLSISGIVFNGIHNVELHSNTGMEALTHQVNRVAHALERWTGRAPDDPELSTPGTMYGAPDEFFVFDSFASSPWHVALIGIAATVALMSPRKNKLALAGLGLAFAGCLFFSMTLRWQIWNARYHLPELLLFMPLVAVLLTPRAIRWLAYVVGTALLAFGILIVTNNRSRPIFDANWRAQPRLEQLLSFQGVKYYEQMRAVAATVAAAGCADVGLKLSPDKPEYALWLMLREAGFRGQIHHRFVEGPSSRLPEPEGTPDVIVTTSSVGPAGEAALMFPTRTEFGQFTLYWSKKMSEQRARAAK